jgi:hypothetical protein
MVSDTCTESETRGSKDVANVSQHSSESGINKTYCYYSTYTQSSYMCTILDWTHYRHLTNVFASEHGF